MSVVLQQRIFIFLTANHSNMNSRVALNNSYDKVSMCLSMHWSLRVDHNIWNPKRESAVYMPRSDHREEPVKAIFEILIL